MSLPNNSPVCSSTDRAVKIAVAVLLPAVFGIFAIRHLWSAPELHQTNGATASLVESNVVPVAGTGTAPSIALESLEHAGPRDVQVAQPKLQPLFPRVLSAIAEEAFAETAALRHAPLELSTAGQIFADPRAFAPRALHERGEQSLSQELAKVDQVDLYSIGPETSLRFGNMKADVAAERNRFQVKQNKLEQEARRGELGRRRLRTDRGRREVRAEISAALFGTEDPFQPPFQPLKNWLHGRDDLEGLPLAMGKDCRLESIEADKLQSVSATFQEFRRKLLQLPDPATKEATLLKWVNEHPWNYQHIAGLMQVLTAEDEPLRLELVRIVSRFRYPQATTALARIAVFDLSADVRRQAVAGLKKRRPEDYRDKLLSGLRYVWPPAADNAARALVSLDDRPAYDQLVELVDDDDPRAPFQTAEGHWATRELVRVNHMRNCLLCHAPAVASNARVTGTFPSPYDPLPRVYYKNQSSGNLVRADVTYLRQDFSVVHAVPSHAPWPEQQRFDYFVRERKLSKEEAVKLSERYSNGLYPQRAAILYAMTKLEPDSLSGNLSSVAKPLLSLVNRRGD